MSFRDSRRNAPQQKYGTAGTQYPTPNILDFIIVEDVPMERAVFLPALPGTPHPEKPTALLVWRGPVVGNNNEVALRLVYCTSRSAQDPYNARITYSDESEDYPIYTRTYFLPRLGYARLARGIPLTSLIDVSGTGGTGYLSGGSGQAALVFTGGSGSGATGLAEIVAGVPVAYLLTDGGTGWTAGGLPTVTVAGSHTVAATVTPSIQSASALLVKQESVPEEGEFESLFLRITRVYETLPGPEIADDHQDPQTGTDQTVYKQRVTIDTPSLPVAAVQILAVSSGSPATVTTAEPHGLPAGTFPVRIAGVTGSTPAVGGDYTATHTGAYEFTIPVAVTVDATANTGYVSPLKNEQVILDSNVDPDPAAGDVVGTLVTKCASLPGRVMDGPYRDTERRATVNKARQYVHMGYGAKTLGSTYRGQTVEKSEVVPQGTAWAIVETDTILLPGDAITTLSFDEELGATRQTIRTRVAIASAADTPGLDLSGNPPAGPTSPGPFVTMSKIVEENSVVGVKTTSTLTRPASRDEVHDGSEPMPSTFTYITGWVVGSNGFVLHGPFLGVNYTLKVHGVAAPAFCTVSYTWGINPNTVTLSGIFAPISGRSGVGLPINGQTLHDGYLLDEVASVGTQTVEQMDESIPARSEYVTGDPYVRSYTDRPHEGGPDGLWERRVYFFIAT